MANAYTISCLGYTVTLDAIAVEFQRRNQSVPSSLADLIANGCRYSNQDFDVLSAAIHQLAGGNNILPIYQALSTTEAEPFNASDLARCRCSHSRIGHLQGRGACLHFLSATPNAGCNCTQFEATGN